MTPQRFHALAGRYPGLRIAVVGDFCLDRYLEIDPALAETSIETGLPVHNVVNVRAQPGAAGTVLNNLVALGVGEIHALGFCGDDGEGYELLAALAGLPGVRTDRFVRTRLRRTFTYCKPLVVQPGRPPTELNRLDTKNHTPTPPEVEAAVAEALRSSAGSADAVVVMDQVDAAGTGVVTAGVRAELARIAAARPQLRIIADSRRGLAGWPAVTLKMNAAELAKMLDRPAPPDPAAIGRQAAELAARQGRDVFVTMAERGLAGATPAGRVEHVPALPLRGPIDVVGAGDSVTANLATALAAGADLADALRIAAAASSIVIHQLGTTGTASPAAIAALL